MKEKVLKFFVEVLSVPKDVDTAKLITTNSKAGIQ